MPSPLRRAPPAARTPGRASSRAWSSRTRRKVRSVACGMPASIARPRVAIAALVLVPILWPGRLPSTPTTSGPSSTTRRRRRLRRCPRARRWSRSRSRPSPSPPSRAGEAEVRRAEMEPEESTARARGPRAGDRAGGQRDGQRLRRGRGHGGRRRRRRRGRRARRRPGRRHRRHRRRAGAGLRPAAAADQDDPARSTRRKPSSRRSKARSCVEILIDSTGRVVAARVVLSRSRCSTRPPSRPCTSGSSRRRSSTAGPWPPSRQAPVTFRIF